MKRIMTIVLTVLALLSGPALAQSARPPDSQVESLIEQMEKAASQFERSLDRDLKKATVRSPSGEMQMESFLEDFNTGIERLKERFDKEYSASSELAALMHRAMELDTFIRSQPPSLKGRSEWDSYTASLNALAAAYGSSFPMKEDNPPRRMNDLEIKQAADSAVKSGSSLKSSLSKVYGKDEDEARKAAAAEVDAMSKGAKGLKARVDDHKPASGEAAVFTEAAKKLKATLSTKTLTPEATKALDGINVSLRKVEQAFGMTAT
jgi:hypothetical protein